MSADSEDMNKKFLELLAKELSLIPEAIAKMFGDYHLNCTRRRANEREQILTLRSKNHFSELERARAAVVELPKAD
jgi:hypothetical protein